MQNITNMFIKPKNRNRLSVVAAVVASALSLSLGHAQAAGADWKDHAISPVANPIYFEDPRIDTEIRPVFLDHGLPKTFHFAGGGSVPLGGDIKVFAVQLRYALTERLGLIATKDGYNMSQPDNTLKHTYGWAGLTAGLKYAAIDNPENQFILTPGVTIELPTGNAGVFQTKGAGLWNVFASAEKGWSEFHVTGNAGFLVPNDFSKQTAQAHYSVQADYYACQYFIPFVSGNGYTVLSSGNNKLLGAVDLNTEFNDLSDFGSTKAQGRTQLIVGVGFRSRICNSTDIGFAYEYGLSHPQGIFKDRFTVDLIWHF